MNILLFGHTGFIGRNIYQCLTKNTTYTIKTLSSKELDFNNPIIPPDLFDGIDVIINSIGVMSNDKFLMENIHHHTPKQLAIIAKQQGVKSWLNLSAMGADEHSDIAFVGSKGRGDKALLDLTDDNFRVIIIRPSLVFGQGGTSTELFLRLIKLPIWLLPNHGKFIIQPIHVDDVALTFLKLLTYQKSNMIYCVGDCIILKDYLKILSNNFYKKEPIFIINIPLYFVRFLLKIGRYFLKNPLFNADNLLLLENSQMIDGRAFEQILGRKPISVRNFYF